MRLDFLVGALLAGTALLAALSLPVQAGTKAAPEITDPANDQAILIVPVGGAGQLTSADIQKAWVDGETATTVDLNILIQGTGTTTTTTAYTWTFHATPTGGADVLASATSSADQPAPGGV